MAASCNCLYGPGDPRCCVNRQRRSTVVQDYWAWVSPTVAPRPNVNVIATFSGFTYDDQPREHEGREC